MNKTEILKELIEIAEDGYKLHVSNGSHQEFLQEDREVLREAKKWLLATSTNVSPQAAENESDGEKEIMMQAFDKVQKLFECREWIMQGRGNYRDDDDRYKEEVRYLFDEFLEVKKDTWANIKSKSVDYRNKIIEAYKKENPAPFAISQAISYLESFKSQWMEGEEMLYSTLISANHPAPLPPVVKEEGKNADNYTKELNQFTKLNKEIYTPKKLCPNCNGDGFLKYGLYADDSYYEEDCEQCNTTGYINVAPTPSPEEQKLICSLDAQQCQQECKHKSDRTKCPFTNPIKEEGKEVKEEKQVTLTDHEIKGIAELWIKTINGEYEYANATSFAAGFKMAMLLYYKPSTPLSPAHFIAGYTAKQ